MKVVRDKVVEGCLPVSKILSHLADIRIDLCPATSGCFSGRTSHFPPFAKVG